MTCYKRTDQNMSTIKTEELPNSSFVIQVEKRGFANDTNVFNVCLHL